MEISLGLLCQSLHIHLSSLILENKLYLQVIGFSLFSCSKLRCRLFLLRCKGLSSWSRFILRLIGIVHFRFSSHSHFPHISKMIYIPCIAYHEQLQLFEPDEATRQTGGKAARITAGLGSGCQSGIQGRKYFSQLSCARWSASSALQTPRTARCIWAARISSSRNSLKF